MKDILNQITPQESLTILNQLAQSDKKNKDKILKLAKKVITDVDIDEICNEVFSELDSIDVHELWDRSGSNSYGEYTPPEEMAFEMVEDVLEPFNQEIFRLLDLKMYKEATDYCKGVSKGIYNFDNESTSEFRNWAEDVAGECFSYLEKEFSNRCKDRKSLKLFSQFIEDKCSKWSR